MRERIEFWLKVGCGVLVVILLCETGRAIMRNRPFVHATIPAVPTLAANTNAAPANGPLAAASSAPPLPNLPTNAPVGTNQGGTNLIAKLAGTNSVAALAAGQMATNAPGQTNVIASSNVLAQTTGMNATNAGPAGTNTIASAAHAKRPRSRHSPMGMGFMPGMGGPAAPLPDLPRVDQARIDKIVSSELLGPVPHPMPIALLGIAGNTAFLRSDSGETGLEKEGDSLGNLKLLRIGINRVLIEQNGEKQELMIFDGMGGDSLLTTSNKNSNETTSH